MIEAYLRPLYQQCLVRPISNFFKAASPFTITALSCLLGSVVAPALYFGLTITAVIFLLASGYLDTVYNSVAKDTGQLTAEASLFDIVGDRVVELFVIIGLFAVDPAHRGILALMMLGSCYIYITCYLIVALYSPHDPAKRFKYSPGLIERSEAFIFFIAMILLPSYFVHLSTIFSALVILTGCFHIREFMHFRSQYKKIKE